MILRTIYYQTEWTEQTVFSIAEQIKFAERIVAEQQQQIEELKAMTPEEVAVADAAAKAEAERCDAEEQAADQQADEWAKHIDAHNSDELCLPNCAVCSHDYLHCTIVERKKEMCDFCKFRSGYDPYRLCED